MRPGIARIRAVFDYETQGGSPLLGVNGIVIITHGSARARMLVFACEVAATMARARVPQLIADALAADRALAAAAGAGAATSATAPTESDHPADRPQEVRS